MQVFHNDNIICSFGRHDLKAKRHWRFGRLQATRGMLAEEQKF
jgi:hypothetical protein